MNAAERRDRKAAEKQVDPNRLLEGEDPATPYPLDARHWIDTYRELLTLKDRMLRTAEEGAAQPLKKAAAREVASTDLVALRAERARFNRRLDFWTQRLTELEKIQPAT